MVFFRRRGLPEKKKTTWKKYNIAYKGTSSQITVASASTTNDGYPSSKATTITYYDTLSFGQSGEATGIGSHSVSVSYNTYQNANSMDGKIMLSGSLFYYILSNAATRKRRSGEYEAGGTTFTTYFCYVYKDSYGAMTASTAKNFTQAGTYIEDVESEDPNAYPDNGPLGLYFYIKQ